MAQGELINDPVLRMRDEAACEDDTNVSLSKAEQEAVRRPDFWGFPESGTAFVAAVLDQLRR